MAGGKGYTRYKEIVINKCLECGADCGPVLVAKTKATKEQGIPTGMMWRCTNGHMHRNREYTVELRKF